MIADLKPYPAMKDSGVPWMGEVPAHWEVVPPKRILLSRSAGTAAIKNTAATEPRTGYVPAFSATGQDVWLPKPSFSGPGLVLSAVGARCGKTFRADGQWAVVANTHVLLVNPPQCRDYWWYVTNNELWWDRAGAAQPFVQVSKTLNRPWAVPLPDEQAAIVRFLDHADRRIRRYIRAKQKLIKLLEEQKQAIIHRAVTRGLDPNVRLKPSGVDWLGDVPEHWRIDKLKHCLKARLAYGVLKPDKSDSAMSVPIVRILDVSDGTIWREKLERISPAQDAEFTRTNILPRDVIVSVVGTIGRSAVVPDDIGHANLSRALCRVQLNALLAPWFFQRYCLSRAFLDQAESVPAGSAQRVLNLGDLRQFDIGLPPISEQRSIVSWLAAATDNMAKGIERAREEIVLLREYRTRLIADVVTGKLDVREASARLPDETDEPEPLDETDAMIDAEEGMADDLDAALEAVEA